MSVERMTVDEYLARERPALDKHDLVDGIVRERATSNWQHALVATNLVMAVHSQLKGTPLGALGSNMKIEVVPGEMLVYPDMLVHGEAPRFHDDVRDVLLNPTVIFEILSPSTESYDRGLKAVRYRSIPSLQEYVLIAQDRPLVERYARHTEDLWILETAEGLDRSIALPSIGCTLALADVYDRIEFAAI